MLEKLNPFAGKIAAGLAFALLLSGLGNFVLLARLDGCNEAKGEAQASYRGCKAGLITTTKSLTDVTASLNRKNAESDARAAEAKAAREREAMARAELAQSAQQTQKQIDTANRIAAGNNSVCAVSEELWRNSDGL